MHRPQLFMAKPPAGSSLLFGALADSGRIKQRKDGSYRMVLEGVDEIDWFTDRPFRSEGLWKPQKLIRQWDSFFESSDPNAQASFKADQERELITFEMFKPKYNDKKQSFSFKIDAEIINERENDLVTGLEGKPLNEVTLFIDDATTDDDVSAVIRDPEIECIWRPRWYPNGKNLKLNNRNLADVDLSGADLSGADLTGADLSNSVLTDAVLSNANLTNANLSNTNLAGSKLDNVISSGIIGYPEGIAPSVVKRGYIIGAGLNLRNADLSGLDLSKATLSRTNLDNANLTNANLSSSDLSGAILNNAMLTKADFTNANFTGAGLANANLAGGNFENAKFDYAIMNRIKTQLYKENTGERDPRRDPRCDPRRDPRYYDRGCDTKDDTLYPQSSTLIAQGANMINASLTGANLTAARLTEVDFRAANLTGANLSKVQFRDNIMEGANMNETNLYQTDFITQSLSGVSFEDARWLSTLCPKGGLNGGGSGRNGLGGTEPCI